MAVKQQISQQQGQRQQLRLSQQQLLVAGLLEGSIVELEDKVKREIESNPALEEVSDNTYSDTDFTEEENISSEPTQIDGEQIEEGIYVDVDDYSDGYLASYGSSNNYPQDYNPAYAEGQDLTEYLNSQLDSIAESEKQRKIGQYIIGSLDDEGFLTDSPAKITDDINIYSGLEVTSSQVIEAIALVQRLDPAGVCARSVSESLRLQAERDMSGNFSKDFIKRVAVAILDDCFEDLTKKRYDAILKKVEVERTQEGEFTKITRDEMVDAIAYIRGLNPHPCQIITESKYLRASDSIIPDFRYDTQSQKLTVSSGRIPQIAVNSEYKKMLEEIERSKSRAEGVSDDSETFLKDRIASAQMFIDALDQRKSILTQVMTAIIKVQSEFFNQGCEDYLLKPLTMKQIADSVGCDISTVSRVANSKYIDVDGQYTFQIKHFFSEKISTTTGEVVSNKSIMEIIKSLVSSEDKKEPLTDDEISASLKSKGFNVARRTVAKYRATLDIPSTRERKEED